MFGKTSRNIFLSFFCGIVKVICELRHTFLINLRLRQINNLRPTTLFLRKLRSAAGKFTHSAVCRNTYASPPCRDEVSYEILSGRQQTKLSSLGSDFTDQVFTGELSEVDSAGVLRQSISFLAVQIT